MDPSRTENLHGRAQRVRPIRRACMDCHARKVKCDGAMNGFPCSNCKSAQVECAVAERRKRKRTTNGESRPGRRDSTDARESQETPTLSQVPEVPTIPASADSTSPDYAGECELAKQHLVDFFSQDLKDNPIRARSTYVGSELSNLNYLTRQRLVNQHVYHYPCSNVYVPRVFRNSQTLATPNLIPKDAFVLPPKHVSDVLVADYFEHIHPGFPIIDRERFLSLYHDPCSSPSILLLQAVCLAGSHVTKGFRNSQDLKVAFFRRAKALLDGRYEEDRMHVVQAALLLTWFSDGGDDICANAWWWIGIAAKTAIGLGMHRDVGPSTMPENDKRTWRIIWWCLVQFDCLVSLCYGRPQSINLDDCDVLPLRLEDFDASIHPKAANFVMQHARLCAVVSDLVRSHFSVRARQSGTSRRDVLEIVDSALVEWLICLPLDLREHPRQSTADWNPWALLLHLAYNTVLIQFHRPLSETADDLSPGNASNDDDICADAASNIVQIFEQLDQRSVLRYCWFWAPSTLFTAVLQLSGQLRCKNPILAFRVREKYDSGMLSLRKLTRHWLFATSVLRLFQSNSIEPSRKASGRHHRVASSPTADQIPPEQESPAVTVSSLGSIPSSTARAMASDLNGDQPDPQEMDWMRLLQYGDANALNMHVEPNRWQNSLNEWQSIYWSDPLASIRLEDNLGEFRFEWPS